MQESGKSQRDAEGLLFDFVFDSGLYGFGQSEADNLSLDWTQLDRGGKESVDIEQTNGRTALPFATVHLQYGPFCVPARSEEQAKPVAMAAARSISLMGKVNRCAVDCLRDHLAAGGSIDPETNMGKLIGLLSRSANVPLNDMVKRIRETVPTGSPGQDSRKGLPEAYQNTHEMLAEMEKIRREFREYWEKAHPSSLSIEGSATSNILAYWKLADKAERQAAKIGVSFEEYTECLLDRLRSSFRDYHENRDDGRTEGERTTLELADIEAWRQKNRLRHKALRVESIEVDGEFIGFASVGCGCGQCVAYNQRVYREAERARELSHLPSEARPEFLRKNLSHQGWGQASVNDLIPLAIIIIGLAFILLAVLSCEIKPPPP